MVNACVLLLGLDCRFSVLVFDEDVGVAAALLGFNDDVLDRTEGLEQNPKVSLQLLLRELHL
jgi:hypothetical protein